MFYYISGTLVHKGENFAVIDAGGVGYKIYSTLPSLSDLGEVNTPAKMFTYLRTGEDIFDLYGFTTHEELNMFQMLISVSRVGAKAGIAILSAVPPAKFALAVVTNDVNTIKSAPGVGLKLAERIILELKDKFKNIEIEDMAGVDIPLPQGDTNHEALSALMVLGYSAQEAKKALSGVDLSMKLEDIIKHALKKL